MTAAMFVVPNASAEEAALPGVHVADLYNGMSATGTVNQTNIGNFFSDIYAATGNTRVNAAQKFSSYFGDRGADVLSSAGRSMERTKTYTPGSDNTGASVSGGYSTDSSYMYWVRLNPYQTYADLQTKLSDKTIKPRFRAIAGNLMVGVSSNLMYAEDSGTYQKTIYDFSDNVDGGYFTLDYAVKNVDGASEDSFRNFFDNLYVICWDANNNKNYYYTETNNSSNDSAWVDGTKNYVAVKLSDFAAEQNFDNAWSAVKIPMSVFSTKTDGYNYVINTMSWTGNNSSDDEYQYTKMADRMIDFTQFGGIGIVWMGPTECEIPAEYTQESEYNKRYDFMLGNVAIEQVLAPEVSLVNNDDGSVTLNWNDKNADSTFTPSFGTAETIPVTYSVYKDGAEVVSDTDATSYTDTNVGKRGASYCVTAHTVKKYDQRTQESENRIRTLSLDSAVSNTVSVGEVIDTAHDTHVFDLFKNTNPVFTYATTIANLSGYGQEFNLPNKNRVSYSGGIGNVINADYGTAYGGGYSIRKRADNSDLAANNDNNPGDNVQIESNIYPNKLKNASQTTGRKITDDKFQGIFSQVCTYAEDSVNQTSVIDLSEIADTGVLTFEFKYWTNADKTADQKANFLNNVYVLARDYKDVQTGMYADDTNKTGNAGIADSSANYVAVKLSDFVDISTIPDKQWINVQVPFSAFSSFDSTKNYFVKTTAFNSENNTCYQLDNRPIDFKYFNGAGLIFVPDSETYTLNTSDNDRYAIVYDSMRIDNIQTPVVSAQYDDAAKAVNLTWTDANEGYVEYDVYKNNEKLGTTKWAEYTDTTGADVDAEYTVAAKRTFTYPQNGTTGSQTVSSLTEGGKIMYAKVDFAQTDSGVTATGTFNPGAEGVWIVVKFDKNYSVEGQIHFEDITKSSEQQVTSYNAGAISDGGCVKSFLWNNLKDITPKIDAARYPEAE